MSHRKHLLRWSELLAVCKAVGLTEYTVRAAIRQGLIPRVIPQVRLTKGEPKAYYCRSHVEHFCNSFLANPSAAGVSPDHRVKAGTLSPDEN